jgi:hypothetical protein
MNKIKDLKINNKFAAAPILIFALTVLFSSFCFIFNFQNITLSLVIAVAVVAFIGIKFDRSVLISCIITVVLLILAVIVAGHVYDMSYDGMYFHKEAVYSIAKGWNPLKTNFTDFSQFGNLQDLPLWLNNYPKGVWSLYACVYNLAGKIECAKGANIIFVLMLFFTAYDTVSTVFKKKGLMCLFIAAVFTANPVITSQYFTFMNDLPVAALIMVCAFFGMKIYAQKADNWDYICLAAAFASSFAVKFTAPILCGVTLAAFGIAVLIKNKGKKILKPCIVVAVAAAIGVCIMGTDPYIKHIKDGVNPIYPVMGEGAYDIMNTNAPEGLDEMSTAKALAVSVMSQSSPNPGDTPVIKIPFTVGENELDSLSAPDVRLGGFGVFFSGILFLSVLLGIYALFKSKGTMSIVPALVVFVILGLFFPESWWARYSPYVYYIPCLMLLAFSCVEKPKAVWAIRAFVLHNNSKYERVKKTKVISLENVVSFIMCCIILVNSAISGLMVLKRFYKETKEVKYKLQQIADTGKHVLLDINDFPCHEMWFNEANIDYEVVWTMDTDNCYTFLRTTFYQLQDK